MLTPTSATQGSVSLSPEELVVCFFSLPACPHRTLTVRSTPPLPTPCVVSILGFVVTPVLAENQIPFEVVVAAWRRFEEWAPCVRSKA